MARQQQRRSQAQAEPAERSRQGPSPASRARSAGAVGRPAGTIRSIGPSRRPADSQKRARGRRGRDGPGPQSRCATSPRRCAAPPAISAARMPARRARGPRVRSTSCASSSGSCRAARRKADAARLAICSSRRVSSRSAASDCVRIGTCAANGQAKRQDTLRRLAGEQERLAERLRRVQEGLTAVCIVSGGTGVRARAGARQGVRTSAGRGRMPRATSRTSGSPSACSSRQTRCAAAGRSGPPQGNRTPRPAGSPPPTGATRRRTAGHWPVPWTGWPIRLLRGTPGR